ncbi:hypothetical protein SLE2022_181940 [Rubroshorea leprosula]
MEKKYGIAPKLEHYGFMVDLLGRAGRLQEAYDFIKSMPMNRIQQYGELFLELAASTTMLSRLKRQQNSSFSLSHGIRETMSFFPTYMHLQANGTGLQG